MKHLTDEEARVYNAVPAGRESAVSLVWLENRLDMDGRTIRRVFEEMCSKGYVVCNLREGYFLPDCADDYDEYYMMNNSYCKKFKSKLNHIRAARTREYGEPYKGNPAYPKQRYTELQRAREVSK